MEFRCDAPFVHHKNAVGERRIHQFTGTSRTPAPSSRRTDNPAVMNQWRQRHAGVGSLRSAPSVAGEIPSVMSFCWFAAGKLPGDGQIPGHVVFSMPARRPLAILQFKNHPAEGGCVQAQEKILADRASSSRPRATVSGYHGHANHGSQRLPAGYILIENFHMRKSGPGHRAGAGWLAIIPMTFPSTPAMPTISRDDGKFTPESWCRLPAICK